MARPKKQAGEGRDKMIFSRVTRDEKSYVKQQAELADLSDSEYIRNRVLGYKIIPPKSQMEMALVMELNRIGVNLNQLTKHANAGKTMPYSIEHTMNEIREVLARVMVHGD